MTVEEYMLSQGRALSFNSRGQIRGFRSRPGAPQATPPQGLGPPPGAGSGTNAMGASSWVNTFRDTGSAMQRQALVQRAQMPGSQLFSGISQPIVNEFMAQSPSAAATGMLTNPWTAPFGAAIMGGSQVPTDTATATPVPGFDPDMANMMRDYLRSKAPVRSQWQSATMAKQEPLTSTRYIPDLRRGDYAYATFPSWNRAFNNG